MPSEIRHNYQYVKSFFEERGCGLVSTEYINNHTKLDYICECGNPASTIFNSFQKGHRCKECGINKNKEKRKHTYQYVKDYFKERGCVLLSKEYIGCGEKLDYTCSCGEPTTICFSSFQQGKGCVKCGIEKRKQTNLKKYGVEHNMQDPKIFKKAQKTRFKEKSVETPSGKIIYLQGYEPQAYNKLLEQYNEDEIEHRVKYIPTIKYIGEDNKEHRYFPDFFIPKDNLILEVKSEYTYWDEKWFSTNLLKQQACLDRGYNFEFMIMNH